MTVSVAQQELIDLLQGELAETFGNNSALTSNLDSNDAIQNWLEEQRLCAENIANAASLVGMNGLSKSCQCLIRNFDILEGIPSSFPKNQLQILKSWPVFLMGYLQYFGDIKQESAVKELTNFLADPVWPLPLDRYAVEEISQACRESSLNIEDSLESVLPRHATEDMADLSASDDLDPELLQSLLQELPEQVDGFEAAVEEYLLTKKPDQLIIAQRIAHTVKGSANVVGIKGIANLMHFVEDLLEHSEKGAIDGHVGYLLLDASDCLACAAEYIAGNGPQPSNLLSVMQSILEIIGAIHESEDAEESGAAGFEVAVVKEENNFAVEPSTTSQNSEKVLNQQSSQNRENTQNHKSIDPSEFENVERDDNLPVGQKRIGERQEKRNLSVNKSVPTESSKSQTNMDSADRETTPPAKVPGFSIEDKIKPIRQFIDGEKEQERPDPLFDEAISHSVTRQEEGTEIPTLRSVADVPPQTTKPDSDSSKKFISLIAHENEVRERNLKHLGKLQDLLKDKERKPQATDDHSVSPSIDNVKPFLKPVERSGAIGEKLPPSTIKTAGKGTAGKPETMSASRDEAARKKLEALRRIQASATLTKREDSKENANKIAQASSDQNHKQSEPVPQQGSQNLKGSESSNNSQGVRETKKAPIAAVKNDSAAVEDNDFSFTITETQGQELLRLVGEMQIGNTQILGRVSSVSIGLKSALEYHQKLRALSTNLERIAEMRGELSLIGEATASGGGQEDVLELERYNEIHSFANELNEVVTDAYESLTHTFNDLRELKGIVQENRQLGFESQDMLVNIRMVPVKLFEQRFNRCVRQASRLTGKSVVFTLEGGHVMVDSRVMNELMDPIMHLLRNAVDHGIESKSQIREDIGKPSAGQVRLKFSRQGDNITVVCSDDGRGVDFTQVQQTAKMKGLIDANAELSEEELKQIILTAGFSTRRSVSQTSGRGFGLDIVNEQVKRLKGHMDIASQRGKGADVIIRAPMSMLSAHTLLVKMGTHQLSLLSRGIDQIIYVEKDKLELKAGKRFYKMSDGELLPLFHIEDLLSMPVFPNKHKFSALLVIKNKLGQQCGVLVEAIIASEEQIIKPLPHYAFKVQGCVGACILEDGSVSPVIDLHELPELEMSDVSYAKWRERFDKRMKQLRQSTPVQRPLALVVDDSLSARRSLAQFISDAGLEVVTAKDGLEAIQQINKRAPDIILVDLEMPRMNGLELTSHVRASEANRDIPIVMITSRATEKHRQMAAKAGVSSYLNKPWSEDELMKKLQSFLALI